MRFSLCMRIVLALKLDVKQFLVGHEGVTGTEFWSHGLYRSWSPRLLGTVHLLHATPIAHPQPQVQPGTPKERLPLPQQGGWES